MKIFCDEFILDPRVIEDVYMFQLSKVKQFLRKPNVDRYKICINTKTGYSFITDRIYTRADAIFELGKILHQLTAGVADR